MLTIDIGDLCTHCGKDTALNSGELLFVNRIPNGGEGKLVLDHGADNVKNPYPLRFFGDVTIEVSINGYMCSACQSIECDDCGKFVLEYDIVDGEIYCEDCLELQGKANKNKEDLTNEID